MENQQNESQLTPEELAARKEEMKQFYDESLPYLESQVKYEKLLTEIEEARFKRSNWQYQWAVLMENSKAPADNEDDKEYYIGFMDKVQKLNHKQICIIQEMILRLFTHEKYNNKVWFLSAVEANLINVENIKI